MILTLEWTPEGVRFIDQTKLPLEETYVLATTYQQVADVIVTMVVRGAPAIGVSAAMGIALGAKQTKAATTEEFATEFEQICNLLAGTRPTAVNLFWAIDRLKALFEKLRTRNATLAEVKEALLADALAMYDEDIAACKQMGAYGADLMPDEGTVLTHCNAGALATCGYGTALGVIRGAVERGKKITSSPMKHAHSCKAPASPPGNSWPTVSRRPSSATTWPPASCAKARSRP